MGLNLVMILSFSHQIKFYNKIHNKEANRGKSRHYLHTNMSELSNLFDSGNDNENIWIFSFPESQGDALLLEVQDVMKNVQGCATISISSLTDNPVSSPQHWNDHNWDVCIDDLSNFNLTFVE